MSFQGIRKIRDAKRGTPIIFDSKEISIIPPLKSFQFPIQIKTNNQISQIRTTRDSQLKAESPTLQNRKESLQKTTKSKEKERRTLIGNFLHVNLESIKNGKVSKQLKNQYFDKIQTERIGFNRSSIDYSEPKNYSSPNNFTMIFTVGKGGFGKVWKVMEKSTKMIYAMKQMQKVKIVSKRSVNSVMNQRDLLVKLKHPFLVNMICTFQDRQHLYLVMDYCNRGDLRYHLGNHRVFSEKETRFFVACIVICLEYMHSRRIIHRDLKPQNLVLDQKGYVRVTDLGVSREVKPNNAQDTSGTPGYMSPEVICKMNHSFGVDYFALGVITFEFMTGKRPYLGSNRKQIRQKILAKQVQLDEIPLYGWSKQSVDFVNRLIQRKQQNRLGYNGIEQIKYHPFLSKIDWQLLYQRKIPSPFLPDSIQQDYVNYKQCISQDTEIQDIQEYQMLLRHQDTQLAFQGYDYLGSFNRQRKTQGLTGSGFSTRKKV